MRTVFSLLLLLLATTGSLPTPGYREESRYLATAGFGNITENFRNEEVEICMVEGLTTEDFRELGVNTIGGRARLRAAARDWLQIQGTQEGQAREGQDTANVVQEAEAEVAVLEVPHVVHRGLEPHCG